MRYSKRWKTVVLFAGIAIGLVMGLPAWASEARGQGAEASALFARDNLIAWCIVPFDSKKRPPEARAAMLEKLGFKHFAYDWRAEHIPSFDAEIDALKRHHVSLDAFWVAPGELNRESRRILDVLGKRGVKAQLWVLLDFGADRAAGAEQARRVEAACARLEPLAREAEKIGCTLALYNHGGWFGEPENQLAIIETLERRGVKNVGMVYNLHHGHAHLDRLGEILAKIKPRLVAINLNGMDPGGDRVGRKILPLGQGERDLEVLRTIVRSGYRGPIGILGHTDDDAEERLKDNLDGLDWLVPQLGGHAPGPRPRPRTPVPPKPAGTGSNVPAADAARVRALVEDARNRGDAAKGAAVFASTRFACVSCHRVGDVGGSVGPELGAINRTRKPEEIVASILWPRLVITEGYRAVTVATIDGRMHQGYRVASPPSKVALRNPATGALESIAADQVEAIRDDGSLMPDGLADAMTPEEKRDLVRFVLELGNPHSHTAAVLAAHTIAPAEFTYNRAPLVPADWPDWQARVNRDRLYDFYTKEAIHFAALPYSHLLLPAYPGLDGGRMGHWGNQDETTWADARWQKTRLGSMMRGVFRGAGVTVPKGICVQLEGGLSCCFNPETLLYEAVWKGGFVTFSDHRYGLLDGLIMVGQSLPRPAGTKPVVPFRYQGCYRDGGSVVFAYNLGGVDYFDTPTVKDGKFERIVAPRAQHPLGKIAAGGKPQWPQALVIRGKPGVKRDWPYVLDEITPPIQNPWNALFFLSGIGFQADGTAYVCSLQGDVWRVSGLDEKLEHVAWRRFASGLHQASGLVVRDGRIYVIGRDEITRLHDANGDGEADFYECFSNAQVTSPAGHDFVNGLVVDRRGRFYTASSNQGVLQFSEDGSSARVFATGVRNPDGLGIDARDRITVPSSEGEWTPASLIGLAKEGEHFGYRGPRGHAPPDLPLVYLPRGLDNSSASQVLVPDDRWGPLGGKLVHFSFGAGTHFLLMEDEVDGQAQGAIVPLPGQFASGVHRGAFCPGDGQLYAVGSAGWGTYTTETGCLSRVRYTGGPVLLPTMVHACENGLLVRFSGAIDASRLAPQAAFVQAWNYRYGPSYGSPEFSTRHPGTPGHDRLEVTRAIALEDGHAIFLEIPEIQPVNQLHLHLALDAGRPIDVFATIHRLGAPFTGYEQYRPVKRTIAAHPILADMAALSRRPDPVPWRDPIAGSRAVTIEAGKNLSYLTRSFRVRPGEPIKLIFVNPDVVPHNWALLAQGAMEPVGKLADALIAEPDAGLRHYIPRTPLVLYHSGLVGSQEQSIIYFRAPLKPGRYPYICTFPGHWKAMNGEMVVGSEKGK